MKILASPCVGQIMKISFAVWEVIKKCGIKFSQKKLLSHSRQLPYFLISEEIFAQIFVNFCDRMQRQLL